MRLTVSVPDEVGDQAAEAAHEEGTSVSALVAEAVTEFLARRRRRAAVQRIEALVGGASAGPDAVQALHHDRERSGGGRA